MPDFIPAAFLILFSALVIVAALHDLVSFTIPNWISVALVVAFVPAVWVAGLPVAAIGVHLAVGLAAFAVAVAMFALRWIGGGDAKLLAAVALWIGLPALGTFALATAVAGGALALVLLAVRKDWVRAHAGTPPAWAQRLMQPDGPAPYGVAIAFGSLFALPATDILAAVQGSL